MHSDNRQALLVVLSHLDRIEAEAGETLTDMVARAEDLRQLIVKMRTKVEEKMDAAR